MDEFYALLALRALFFRPPPPKVSAAFFHGRALKGEGETAEDGDFLFELVAAGYRRGQFPLVVIPGGDGSGMDGTPAWAGSAVWRRRLEALGVGEIADAEATPINTREENRAFLGAAKSAGFKSAVVVAQPHQIPRIMLGMVDEMDKVGYPMRVYPLSPSVWRVNWTAYVRGSQGKNPVPRVFQVLAEARRWGTYQAKGDLVSWRRLLEYLTALENE